MWWLVATGSYLCYLCMSVHRSYVLMSLWELHPTSHFAQHCCLKYVSLEVHWSVKLQRYNLIWHGQLNSHPIPDRNRFPPGFESLLNQIIADYGTNNSRQGHMIKASQFVSNFRVRCWSPDVALCYMYYLCEPFARLQEINTSSKVYYLYRTEGFTFTFIVYLLHLDFIYR